MGGDQLVEALCGEEAERDLGEEIRSAEKELYSDLIGEVEPLPDADALIDECNSQGAAVILASSAKEEEVDHYLDLLSARERVDGWTTSADVEETKPEPDLVLAALEKGGGGDALLIGDTPWDVIAAARAGVATVALLTGGFSDDELTEAGAVAVHESLGSLVEQLASDGIEGLAAAAELPRKQRLSAPGRGTPRVTPYHEGGLENGQEGTRRDDARCQMYRGERDGRRRGQAAGRAQRGLDADLR